MTLKIGQLKSICPRQCPLCNNHIYKSVFKWIRAFPENTTFIFICLMPVWLEIWLQSQKLVCKSEALTKSTWRVKLMPTLKDIPWRLRNSPRLSFCRVAKHFHYLGQSHKKCFMSGTRSRQHVSQPHKVWTWSDRILPRKLRLQFYWSSVLMTFSKPPKLVWKHVTD